MCWWWCVCVCVCVDRVQPKEKPSLSLYVEYAQYCFLMRSLLVSEEDRRIIIIKVLKVLLLVCVFVCVGVCMYMCIRIWWALLSISHLDLLLYAATAVLLFLLLLVVFVTIIIVVVVVVVELLVFVLFVLLETIIFIGHVNGPQKFGSLCFVEDLLDRYTILFTPVDR